jgi:hypothetical protein
MMNTKKGNATTRESRLLLRTFCSFPPSLPLPLSCDLSLLRLLSFCFGLWETYNTKHNNNW